MFNLFNIANAQEQPFSKVLSDPTVKDLTTKITDNIVAPIVEVMFVLAFLVFVWGMYEMIASPDDSDARTNGKNAILWSSIGMVIMLSVFGLIRLIGNTVGIDPFA